MNKISIEQTFRDDILKEQKLTIGMDLGDHWSCYYVLDEAGNIILEQKVAMTPEAMKQTFAKIPPSLIALETGHPRTDPRPQRRYTSPSNAPPSPFGSGCIAIADVLQVACRLTVCRTIGRPGQDANNALFRDGE